MSIVDTSSGRLKPKTG